MSDEDYTVLKFLRLGDSKSGLLAKFVDDPESNAYSLKDSAGLDSKIKTVELNGKKVKLQIIVYDATAIESFNKAKKWVERNDIYAKDNVDMLLIGNNCDLEDNDEKKVVKKITAEELASKFGIRFIETSAEDPTILEQTLKAMASEII